MDNVIVSDNYSRAYSLNTKIKANAQIIQEAIFELGKNLLEMRDGKLYKELGYQNFAEYCENEVGIKKSQAYNYITIVDKFSEDFVQSTGQIGVEKLSLLSRLDEQQRAEIVENTDLENTSVRELKAKLAELQEKNKTLEEDNSKLSESNSKLSVLESDAEAYKEKISQLESEVKFKSDSIEALESTIDELENRPIDVAVADNSHEINNLMDAMKRMDLDWGLKYRELQEETTKEIRDKNIAHTEEINQIKAEYEKKISELSVPETVTETVTVPDTKEIFKAYFSLVIDSTKKLIEFIGENPSDAYRKKAIEYFDITKKKLEE